LQRYPQLFRYGFKQRFSANYRKEKRALNISTTNKNKLYKQLFEEFSGYGLSIALRFVGCKEDAWEVLNDSFLKLFSSMQEDMEKKQIKAFLRRIVINTAIDYYRKSNRRPDHLDLDENIQDGWTSDVEQKLSAEEILKALHQLPQVQRFIFTLHEIEGYNHDEISKKLEINVSTCRSHLRRAKFSLQQILKFHERQLG
jgi:RNA polymerase sigma-70 factor (ECF subfamily)